MTKSFPHSFPQALDTIFIEFIAILPQNYQVFHIKMNRLFYWIPTGFPHFFSFPHRIVENLWKTLWKKSFPQFVPVFPHFGYKVPKYHLNYTKKHF